MSDLSPEARQLEPILTRILGELAPVVGGDLLEGGVKHRIGLAYAIADRLGEHVPDAYHTMDLDEDYLTCSCGWDEQHSDRDWTAHLGGGT